MIRRKGLGLDREPQHRRDPVDRRAGRDLPERLIQWAESRTWGGEQERSGSERLILRAVVDRSCESLPDAVAADLQTIGNGGLRQATAAEHADAAGLRHGREINQGDDQKQGQKAPEEKGGKGHLPRCDWEGGAGF